MPALERDEQSQIVFRLAQRLADLPDDLAPLRRRYKTPFLERRNGRLDCLLVTGLIRARDPAKALARRRIERRTLLASGLVQSTGRHKRRN